MMQNRKIIDYKAVTGGNVESLTQRVKDLLADGWQPFGSISTSMSNDCDYRNSQAMVKYEDE